MEGTTEPIIAVIGHPIAGNPSQFSVERALRSLEMDWRVLSFDVRPDDIAAALEGFSVTGIAGVMIDQSVMEEASRWYAARTNHHADHDQSPAPVDDDGPVWIDCLFRDDQQRFVGSFQQRAWIDEQVAQHGGERRIWIGETLRGAPLSGDGWPENSVASPPDPQAVREANLIVIAKDAGQIALEAEDWPSDDGSTLVIDCTRGHPEVTTMKELGYRVVTDLARRIGTLQGCLKQWTGEDAQADVIRDAIEEYLGV